MVFSIPVAEFFRTFQGVDDSLAILFSLHAAPTDGRSCFVHVAVPYWFMKIILTPRVEVPVVISPFTTAWLFISSEISINEITSLSFEHGTGDIGRFSFASSTIAGDVDESGSGFESGDEDDVAAQSSASTVVDGLTSCPIDFWSMPTGRSDSWSPNKLSSDISISSSFCVAVRSRLSSAWGRRSGSGFNDCWSPSERVADSQTIAPVGTFTFLAFRFSWHCRARSLRECFDIDLWRVTIAVASPFDRKAPARVVTGICWVISI